MFKPEVQITIISLSFSSFEITSTSASIKQKGINFKFSTSNGRGKDVEYYSSFIFSIEVQVKKSFKTLVAGGRYNDLTSKIFGLKKIPAVGAAINL